MEEKAEIIKPDVVLVLPRNYGWGMRHPDDRIWFWGPDEKTQKIWEFSRELILQHGLKRILKGNLSLFQIIMDMTHHG